MSFIFKDRIINREFASGTNTRFLSKIYSDVYKKTESGLEGSYVGTLQTLSPELRIINERDFRFFDKYGSQESRMFKGENGLHTKTTLETAKNMLVKSLTNQSTSENNNFAIVKVVHEDVSSEYPSYLRFDIEVGTWSESSRPEIIEIKLLKNMDAVFTEFKDRHLWFNIKELVVMEINAQDF